MNIIVLDDEEIDRAMIRAQLESFGVPAGDITECSTIKEVESIVIGGRGASALITDRSLVGEKTDDFVREWIGLWGNSGIIGVTSEPQPLIDAGCDEVIEKPIDPRKFEEAVRRLKII